MRLVRKIDKKFWALWLAWGALFAVVEFLALRQQDKPGDRYYTTDTLSGHVWWLLDRPWGVNLMGAFWGWLTAHFWFGDPLKESRR